MEIIVFFNNAEVSHVELLTKIIIRPLSVTVYHNLSILHVKGTIQVGFEIAGIL